MRMWVVAELRKLHPGAKAMQVLDDWSAGPRPGVHHGSSRRPVRAPSPLRKGQGRRRLPGNGRDVEKLKPTNPDSLYDAACYCATTAAVRGQ